MTSTSSNGGKSSPAVRVLGWLTAGSLALTAFMALVISPPDVNMGDSVRLLYLHVPTAWLSMYVCFGITTLASVLYLWKRSRSRFWDLTAAASAEIGVLFLGLTLLIGALWGRITWGVYWTWDARLTTTAVLFVMYLGYLAVRKVPASPEVQSRRSAIVAIAAFLNVPIVHQSVEWWRTLHQDASFLDDSKLLDPQIRGTMAWTLFLGVIAFTLLYAWLMAHRFRLAWLEDRLGDRAMQMAIDERRAEAGAGTGGTNTAGAGTGGTNTAGAGTGGTSTAGAAAEVTS